MNKNTIFSLLIATILLLFNCHTVEITDTSKKPAGYVQEDGWYKSYLFGIIDSNSQKGTESSCGEAGVQKVVMKQSCVNIGVGSIAGACTLNIISPLIMTWRSNEIHCAVPPKAPINNSEEPTPPKKNKK